MKLRQASITPRQPHQPLEHGVDESLRRQRAGIPVAVVARLRFLGSVRCRTSGRADDQTSRYRHLRQRTRARFPCRWYLSLFGRMRAQPQSRLRLVPDKLSLATRLPDLLSHLLQY